MPELTMEFELKSFMESLVLSEGFKTTLAYYPIKDDHNVLLLRMSTPVFTGEISIAVRVYPRDGNIRFAIPFELLFDTEDEDLLKAAMVSLNDLADCNYVSKGYIDEVENDPQGVVSLSFVVPESFTSTDAGLTAFWELASANLEQVIREAGQISHLVMHDVRGVDEAKPGETVHTLQ
jgi:hypothetical protein